MRPHLVVVDSPARNLNARLLQALEPVLVEALIAELAVEAFDVGVLRGLARLVEDVAHALGLGPGHEGSAGELRPLVGSHRLRVAPEARHLVQHSHNVIAADAVIDGDVHALVAEVVGDGQALDAPPAGQAIRDEVHAPDFVNGLAFVQRHAFELQALLAPALAYRQVGQLVQPVYAVSLTLVPAARSRSPMRRYLRDVLQRLPTHPVSCIEQPLPHQWQTV